MSARDEMMGGLATNLAVNMRNARSIIKRDWGSLDVPLLGVGADTLELLVGEIDRLRADNERLHATVCDLWQELLLWHASTVTEPKAAT